MQTLFLQQLTGLTGKQIVLGSKSPRRKDLLKMVGLTFRIEPALAEEPPTIYRDPTDYVRQTAYGKLIDVFERTEADLVISADTIVVLDDRIFEKPRDRADAVRILKTLSGQTHQVITAICLKTARNEVIDHAVTSVTFSALSDSEIDQYIDTEEPTDKAGAYGIQGFGAIFIRKIEGCYFNVMGFPLSKFYQNLSGLEI